MSHDQFLELVKLLLELATLAGALGALGVHIASGLLSGLGALLDRRLNPPSAAELRRAAASLRTQADQLEVRALGCDGIPRGGEA